MRTGRGGATIAEVAARWGDDWDVSGGPRDGCQALRRDGSGCPVRAGTPDQLWDVLALGRAGYGAAAAGRRLRVPPGYDQVARRRRFEAAHPGTVITHAGRDWSGSVPVAGRRAAAGPCNDLRTLLDVMDGLAGADAAATARARAG